MIQVIAVLLALAPPCSEAPTPICQLIEPSDPKDNVLRSDQWYIWGGSVVKDRQGTYHMFFSRWERKHGFSAWVTHSEVAHATSEHLTGPYTFVDVALPERGAEYWDGLVTHNPTIHEVDGKYYLYYTGNTGDRDAKPYHGLNFSHRNNQRVGVAVADHPNGPWRRSDRPLIDVSANDDAPDALCTTNPSFTSMADGRFLLLYKCVAKTNPMPFGGPVSHMMAIADRPEGPFVKQPGLAFTHASSAFPTEDPYIWYDGTHYRAVVKDFKGLFTGFSRSLAEFISKDGLAWEPVEHCLVARTNILWKGSGAPESITRLERPQIYQENGKPLALFCAAMRGDDTFNVCLPLTKQKITPTE